MAATLVRLRALILCWIAAVALAGPTAAGDATAKLTEAFTLAYRAGDWEAALAVGVELEAAEPDNPVHAYNLACVAARAGDPNQAVGWLERAAAAGFWRLPLLERDPDLDAARLLSGFREAAASVRENYQLYRAVVAERFAAAPPLLLLPPDHPPRRSLPALVALHGRGGRADGYPMLWSRATARAGVALVIPQGVRATGSGYSWGDPDEAELIVDLTLEWARQRVAVDDERIVLTGFSQGGFVATILGSRHPDRYAGVIPLAGGSPPETDAPAPAAAARMPRYYFMVGSLDAAKQAVRRAADDFRRAGYPVRLRVLPGTGHSFPRDTDRELGKALRFALSDLSGGDDPAPAR